MTILSPGGEGWGEGVRQDTHPSLLEAREKEKYYKSGFGREVLKNLIPW